MDGFVADISTPEFQAVSAGFGEFTDIKLPERAYDITKAREYFAKGGYNKPGPDGILQNDKGERLTLALTYTSQEHSKRLTVLKEEAKKAGLDLELNLVDGATGGGALRLGQACQQRLAAVGGEGEVCGRDVKGDVADGVAGHVDHRDVVACKGEIAGQRGIKRRQAVGIGGQQMQAQGLDSLFPMEELSVMGIAEILPKYFKLLARIRETAEAVLFSREGDHVRFLSARLYRGRPEPKSATQGGAFANEIVGVEIDTPEEGKNRMKDSDMKVLPGSLRTIDAPK